MSDEQLEKLIKQDYDAAEVPELLDPAHLDVVLLLKNEKKKKPAKRILISRIVAAAAALAIVIGAFSVLRAPKAGDITSERSTDGLYAEAADYAEVYSLLKSSGAGTNRQTYGLFNGYKESVTLDSAAEGAVSDNSADTAGNAANGESSGYSTTNVQVEGVDEADVVKNDVKYIYVLSGNTVTGFDTEQQAVFATYAVNDQYYCSDMYLYDGVLSIVYQRSVEKKPSLTDRLKGYTGYYADETGVLTLSVGDSGFTRLSDKRQSGSLVSSRMTNGTIFLVTDYGVNYLPSNPSRTEDYVPYIDDGEFVYCLPSSDVIISCKSDSDDSYVVIASYSGVTGKSLDSVSLLGDGFGVYCTESELYVYDQFYLSLGNYGSAYTSIARFDIEDGWRIENTASASVVGYVNDQFSFHSENGYLFVATTYEAQVSDLPAEKRAEFKDFGTVSANGVFALDSSLRIVGSIKDLGLNEDIYAARYYDGCCYFVTYRQTDPLFSVDITDPTALTLKDQLKLPGFSTYLHPLGEGRLLGLGYSGDEDGNTDGIKAAVYDTSGELKELCELKLGGNNVYSDALDNHKAVFADTERRLIGLPLWELGDQGVSDVYLLLRYTEAGQLEVAASIQLAQGADDQYYYSGFARGVRIGDKFYVAYSQGVVALDLASLDELYRVQF